jgi:hypothetical protein
MKQPGGEPKPAVSADYIRHSRAGYKTYGAIVGSENPTQPFDHNAQITPDLTSEGKVFAEQEARKYFERLDPNEDRLFFVSSNEARALETADVYRRVAHEKSFEVVKPMQARSEYAEVLADGEIRVLETLSLNSKNLVLDFIFNPRAKKTINWEGVDPETKARFEKGAAIVEAGDQGAFGANFLKYSESVKQLVPEITSAVELYETKFKAMLRLLRWAEKKVAEEDMKGKRLKIMAFGHENALVHPLKEFFEEEGLNNCEVVEFSLHEGQVKAAYRGKEGSVE